MSGSAGEYRHFFWAFSVQNLFNKLYFDYGLDKSFRAHVLLGLSAAGPHLQFKLGANFG